MRAARRSVLGQGLLPTRSGRSAGLRSPLRPADFGPLPTPEVALTGLSSHAAAQVPDTGLRIPWIYKTAEEAALFCTRDATPHRRQGNNLRPRGRRYALGDIHIWCHR